MKCSRCEHENLSGLKFCGECGARLNLTCASCGAANSAEQKFCGQCGTKLSPDTATDKPPSPDSYTPKHLAEKILSSRSALEGERKQVTVLFADLKGSMELLADRDPEEARKILDPVLERMMEAVHRYDGTVNQVMGDGIMALFGAPLALEDHAVRACYAALRMQEQISRYADDLQRSGSMPVYIRAGINSGEVVVRSIGSDLHMDYTAVGQSTHLASRIEQLAKPGSTLLSSDTLKLAEGYIQVRRLGAVPVKGLADAVEVYELTGTSHARTRLQAAALRGLTRFVGRQREIEVLNEALAHAGESKGQVVAIVGEPGVGKSRLFWEFTHSHRTHGWLVVEASSVSYGKATPYLPVIDLLKGYFKVAENDDARAIREKVTGKLLTLDRSLEPLLLPLLALLDQPVEQSWQTLDPPQRRRQTLDALKRLWLREAQAQPLVLIFEDLHWIDSETQEFLNGMMDSVPTARLLLLFNYRPEYRHPWGSRTYYSQLRLDPLTVESAQELLEGLLGPDKSVEPLKQVLIERTEGNPLFLEESVRTLVEIQTLTGDRGRYRLARPLEEVQVPPTVQAVLAARIDRLQTEDKRLLQTAAVIGKDVPYVLLEAIAELPEADLKFGLARLQQAEFLYEVSLFPDLEYTFKHALTHETAYGSLLQERRRTLHGKILDAMERLYSERLSERVEQVGHHALRAERWDKAVTYLRQAGVKAFERSANRGAASVFEQALLAIERLPQTRETIEQTVDLCLAMRPCVTPLADMKRLLASVQRAAPLIASLGNPRREALSNGYQAAALTNLGRTREALPLAARGLSIAETLDDPLLRVSSRFFMGQAQVRVGAFRDAIESFEGNPRPSTDKLIELAASPSMAGTLDARSALTSLMFTKVECSLAFTELGDFNNAMLRAEEVQQIAANVGLVYFHALAEMSCGAVLVGQGDISKAIPFLERSLRLGNDADFPGAIIHASWALGHAYNLTNRESEAAPMLERAWDMAESGGFMHFGVVCLMHLADAYSLMAQNEKASDSIDRALSVTRDGGFRAREAWALYMRAKMHGRLPETDNLATELAHQAALVLADQLGMRPLAAHCHLEMARLYQLMDRDSEANAELSQATELYRQMDMQFYLRQTEDGLKAIH